MKKILLTFIVLMCSIPLWSQVIDGITYTFSGSEATITRGNGSFENLVIPEEVTYGGNTYSVTKIQGNAFDYCPNLISLTIPASVTSIGTRAFSGCNLLTSVTFRGPETIGSGLFECPNIATVILTGAVKTIGANAFSGYSKLSSVTISSSVEAIGDGAFNGCSGLTTVNIPSSVTSIGTSAFSGCSGLTSVNLLSAITTLPDGIFKNCSKLSSFTIPASVTSIGAEAFSGCSSFTSITIPANVQSIGANAFYGCSKLNDIIIDANNTAYIIEDGVLFNTAKTELILCLENKEGSYSIPESVKTIAGGAFSGRSGLTAIIIPASVETIGSSAFSGCTGLTSIELLKSVTTIGAEAFSGCSGLTSIELPAYLESLGNNVFFNCNGLKSINIDEGNEYYSSYNGVLFNKAKTQIILCPKSKEGDFTIPSTITNFGTTFSGCDKLTSITIPNSVKSIGTDAFKGCSGLVSIHIPNSVETIGFAFSGCTSLTSITLPSSVTKLGDTNMTGLFSGCSNLKTMTIGCIEIISGGIFTGLGGVSSLIITGKTSVPNGIFSGNGSSSVSIEGSSIKSIGDQSFSNMYYLKSLSISSSVTSIGTSAFSGNQNLDTVKVFWKNPLTAIAANAFSNVKNPCTLVVPQGTTAAYEIAPVWKDFNIVEGSYIVDEFVVEDGVLVEYNGTGGNVVIPNSVKRITASSSVFRSNVNITSVTIPNTVTTIDANAFMECIGLTYLSIPESVTAIGDMAFAFCGSLDSIDVFWSNPLTVPTYTFDGINTSSCVLFVPANKAGIYEEAPVWKTFNVVERESTSEKANQTITFNAIPDKMYGDSSFVLEATSSSGLPVIYSSTSNAIEIKGNVVTIIGAGSVTIDAACAGNNDYFAADDKHQQLTINKAPLTITANNASRKAGEDNPLFTMRFDGFKNNDNKSVLDSLPFALCEADANSPAGFYDIILVSGFDNNYEYSLKKGELEVLPKVVEVPVDSVVVTPAENTVFITWSPNSDANGYKLSIYLNNDRNKPFCVLEFNALGQLTGIEFLRSGTTEGHAITVKGLTSNTSYYFEMETIGSDDEVIDLKSGTFETGGTTGVVETVTNNSNVYAKNQSIIVENAENQGIQIIDISSKTLVNKTASSSIEQFNVAKGVYIVTVGGKSQKVLVQ